MEHYLPVVRRAAGADLLPDGTRGEFPGRVTNNDSEIMNLHLQRNQEFSKLPVQKLIPTLQQFAERKATERHLAMFSLGSLIVADRFAPQYRMSREEFTLARNPALRAKHFSKLFPQSSLPTGK